MEHKRWEDPDSDPIGDVRRMVQAMTPPESTEPPAEIVSEQEMHARESRHAQANLAVTHSEQVGETSQHKGMQEHVTIPDELRQMPTQTMRVSGRQGGKSRQVKPTLQVQRPVQPTSRTMPQRVAFGCTPAGITDTRGIPSWLQQREPSTEQAIVHATKSPPWKRKVTSRRKAQAQKASRKANR